MNKRHQVFVSSTFEDLREERQKVIQALLESDCIPAGMELFHASDESQWELIKRVIDDCDYYLVVLAGRYGSTAADGRGYTEMEYDYAVEKKMPVMGFVHESPGTISAAMTESSDVGKEKLAAFRKKVQQKMVKKWKTSGDLYGAVAASVNQFKKLNPGGGWVKADGIDNTELLKRLTDLQERYEQQRDENAALARRIRETESDIPGLAHGEDRFDVEYQVSKGEDKTNYIASLSWNDIFLCVARKMANPISEEHANDEIATLIITVKHSGHLEAGVALAINNVSFEAIRLQFIALSLISMTDVTVTSNWSRGTNYQADAWALTPKGIRLLAENRAIRRE